MAAFKNKDNGTWYVQFRYTDWKGERQQKLKRGFATKREALEWEREFLMEKQADVNMSFESFVALYEKDIKPKLKLNTWLTKESIIKKKILPYFANRKLSDITAKDIIRWQNEIRELRDCHGKPLSKTYLKTVHNQLSAIFNHAARFYGLNINPARQAGNMGAEERKEMLFWTREEYTRFSEAMMYKPLSFYAFEVLYWCGVREGELLALTPADFDFEKRTVTINKSYQRLNKQDVITTPKTPKSNRVIQMPQFLCDELQDYLKQLYGSNMTKKIFQGILKDTIIASHYQQDYIDSLTYTDDELQKYYEENKNSFDVANYEMITFNGAAASTKDADGNTVQPTEEESAAALQKAKDAANAALEQVKGGELLAKVAKDYEPIGTYSHPEAGTYSGNAATKWVFDESRQEGDTEIVENGTSIYLLVFHSRTRNDYNTVDVRHILFKVDTTGLDSKAEDYQAKLEELKAGKKQEAENALQAWKDGDATEDSFAALANELSDDTGSNTNGGLYKQVYKGQMVTGFNDWCFDESRKAGDTGIVANDATGGSYIGYHVMYFVGEDIPAWQVSVKNALISSDYAAWLDSLVTAADAQLLDGMESVG